MGEKYNDTAHAVENMPRSPHYTNLHTNKPARPGNARGAASEADLEGREASEADLSGNLPIATHDGSLKLATNAEPEHPRQSLWCESVRARSSPRSSHRTLIEVAGGRVEAPDRAFTQGAQRGEGASVVDNDPKTRGNGGSRPSPVQHVSVGGGLGAFHLA